MASLDGKVGEKSPNNFHDVALIQAMLRVVHNPRNQPYLQSHYDGVCSPGTIKAIRAFQEDQGTAAIPSSGPTRPSPFGLPALKGPSQGMTKPSLGGVALPCQPRSGFNLPNLSLLDDPGVIKPGGPTFAKLIELLPPPYKQIRSAAGLHVIYWPGSALEASNAAKEILGTLEFHAEFRKDVASLVNKMFDAYEIVLTIALDGGRRTFQKQYEIATGEGDHTNAGPGESNHNFGQAVDIGFNGFKWMTPLGVSKTDDWWLNKMVATHAAWTTEMWKLRNTIAFDTLGMFPSNKPGDYSHIQRYSDDDVSMVKSLAVLLDTAGTMGWRYNHGYECKLGFAGGTFHKVGKATQIWDKTGPMEKTWIASGRGVPAASITNEDVTKMRNALRADFEKAEAARDKWVAQPK